MKKSTIGTLWFSVIFFALLASTVAHAQITPLGDSFTNTADPSTNYGSATLVEVDGATATAYIQFNLASIPSGATVSQATLKLYVNSVTTAGSFNVDYVNGAWAENTIDASNAPALGATIASNVNVTTADKNQYILVNVTSAVQAWLSGSETNNGLALVANSTFDATFDSKENTTTSHPPELDVAYAGGDGTITGVTTASGSGLSGGGTTGTLSLGLTTACSNNQVLQWNGSAWACASSGTGTITGVTAGTDLTGGGTSGNVTLNLNTTALNSSYAQLAAANTFTGSQTVNGNVGATGVISGSSYQIGSKLFAFGSYANQNAFLGFAGNTTTTGSSNTASGPYALYSNTTGSSNTAAGNSALYYNTTGYFNTATGAGALSSNTTGAYNTAAGYQALLYNTGSYNTATGNAALFNDTTDNADSAFGYAALFNTNQSGGANDAFGYEALYSNTTGSPNDAFGYEALYSNTTGLVNDAFGYQALYSNTTGSYNDAFGNWALISNTTGSSNSAFGFAALFLNTTGSSNSAFGYQALDVNTTGGPNEAFGYEALANNTANNSSAFGYYALFSNTTGTGNQAFGYQALYSNTTANYNAAFGGDALYYNTTGQSNTAVGGSALSQNTTGSENTALGHGACDGNTTSSDVTCLGYNSTVAGDVSNATAIGAHARVEQSNSLVLGAAGVNVGIGTTKPSNILTIGRGAGHPVSDSWETYSSRRWKTNIQTLPDALSKVEQLRGVSYDLKDSGKHEIGVIAEEVGAVLPEVVTYEDNGKDARGVDYSRLTALLIEAVKQQQRAAKQQQALVRQQQQEISTLRKQLRKESQTHAAKEAALQSRMEKLEQHRGEAQLASAHPVH